MAPLVENKVAPLVENKVAPLVENKVASLVENKMAPLVVENKEIHIFYTKTKQKNAMEQWLKCRIFKAEMRVFIPGQA